MRNSKLMHLEVALLVGVTVTLLWGVWSLQEQDALERKMIRLHVIANSDTAEDQALKLQVRDAVLVRATEILENAADMEEAQRTLQQVLPELEATAAEVVKEKGCAYRVSARLERTEFPEKVYDGFALPAGEYLALRLVIGEGAGQNWWCVVFPPLCMTAATNLEETAVAAGMAEEDLALMTEENAGYVLKFRSLELWESLRQWLGK
ncbi:MAG: stage II sporulation protein R [Oscillospiraceae bacterium]|nr:stage II sporulation protein R [Oscillospiraceae bacterium]